MSAKKLPEERRSWRASLVALKENSILAYQTLSDRRFRSFLTILGVFIGVVIIIGVASVLNGFRQSVVDQVEEFGTNNIYIYRMPFVQTSHPSAELRNRKPLDLEDAWAIRELCPSVNEVSPGLQPRRTLVTARYRGEEMSSPQFRGVFPQSLVVGNAVVAEGRFFTESENQNASAVCVIGSNVSEALFPRSSPIGKEILSAGRKLRVVGVLDEHKEGPFGAPNKEDDNILVPYHLFRKIYPYEDDHFIAVQAKTGLLREAMEEIGELLRRRRGVRWNQDNNFELGTADSIIESFDQIIFATLAVMFLLSTVAFMVGGVGVMNIMLVSVKERTREIGVRKAIGARRRDIQWQFLTEAVMLTGIGGFAGILFAELMVQGIRHFLPAVPAATPGWARVAGFVGSVSVGLVFGMWPAIKASRLDPIVALRYE